MSYVCTLGMADVQKPSWVHVGRVAKSSKNGQKYPQNSQIATIVFLKNNSQKYPQNSQFIFFLKNGSQK